MNEIEDLAGDLPPVDTAQITADVAIETAVEAVVIAQETLDTVQAIQEDTNQAWQTEVINRLDSIQNALLLAQSPPTIPPPAAETPELEIDEPSEPESAPPKTKKTRKRRVRVGKK